MLLGTAPVNQSWGGTCPCCPPPGSRASDSLFQYYVCLKAANHDITGRVQLLELSLLEFRAAVLKSFNHLFWFTTPLVFRLDALALSVIATATWLAGWLGGWLGGWLSVTAGIVSKRLNVSENFFDHLIAPS